jgi:hypothetical protein
MASGLIFSALASSVVANPLEARATGTRTVTKTATTTETDTVTKYKTKTQTVTKTEQQTIRQTKTNTKTVVSSTTVTINRPTTVTKTSTRNVPGPTTTWTATLYVPGPATTKTVVSSSTVFVNLPTTVYKTSTAIVTKSALPTMIVSTQTIVSTKTLPVSVSTKTLPVSVSTQYLPASTMVSTKFLPASTVISTKFLPASTVISTLTLPVSVSTKVISASTVVSTKTVQVMGPTVTETSTIKGSTVFGDAQTVTSFSTKEIPGPTVTDLSIATITAVSTAYINNGNGTCGSSSSINGQLDSMTTSIVPSSSFDSRSATTSTVSSSSIDGRNSTSSVVGPSSTNVPTLPFPTVTSNSNSTTTEGPDAPFVTPTFNPALDYANVIKTSCENPKGYYIELSGSGTDLDGTVLLNAEAGRKSYSDYFLPPTELAPIRQQLPQPFNYNSSDGTFTTTWSTGESLSLDGGNGVYSGPPEDAKLVCDLIGDELIDCHSLRTPSVKGINLVSENPSFGYLRVAGSDDFPVDPKNLYPAKLRLIPACDYENLR